MSRPTLFDAIDGALQRFFRRPVRELVRRAVYAPVDLVESFRTRDPIGLPPRGLRSVGAGDFVAVGTLFRDLLLHECRVTPSSQLLDIGCGIGRIALPLTEVLNPSGSYRGFDVSRPAIRWSAKHISREHPNFQFRHIDVRNSEYNPRGQIEPTRLAFPYADGCFDCAIAVSVFTHMLSDAAARYASEAARVLRIGGYALFTFFLLNRESRALTQRGLGSYSFRHPLGSAYVENPKTPEAAVAYEETEVKAFLHNLGLEVSPPVLYGAWCGRQESVSFQDIVIARKTHRTDAGRG